MTNQPPATSATTPPSSGLASASEPVPEANPFRYVLTEGFPDLLARLNCTLAATTYQAGKLVLFRADGGRVSALFRTFDSAMGLAVRPDRLAIGTRNSIWVLQNAADVGHQLEPRGKHDACFVPRSAHITGDIRIHEMAWCLPAANVTAAGGSGTTDSRALTKSAEPELWFVNTRFSCLCTLHSDYSFVPRWRPPFISTLEPEDRCHLNGLAVVEGRPAYVTVLGLTDTKEGWRPDKAQGGAVIDIASGATIADGMAMPHSPRVHHGKLFVLNSGEATLEVVDPKTGKRETVARFPGYARGLALVGQYAFVGLSKIREKPEFGGLPIEKTVQELKCGIACVNIASGQIIEFLEFETGCEEIFDVQLLPSLRYPAVIGLHKKTIDGVFVFPSGGFVDPTLGDDDDFYELLAQGTLRAASSP